MSLAAAPTEPSWSELMRRGQAGDGRAYEALIRSVTPYLRRLVGRRLRDAADVEEVVQEALLTMHRNRYTYEPALPFAPWLATIALRRVVDRVRQNRRHAHRKQAAADAGLTVPPWELRRIEPDEYGRLHAAIGALPKGQREAILLLKLQQMSLKEAAVVTGLSIGALKVSVHRGSKQLRRSLRPRGDCP